MDEETHYQILRQQMVEEQIARRGIRDAALLRALSSVPRHVFVPPEVRRMAYTDGPLPIGLGQTISQPYIVALMTQLLQLHGSEIVLEVGTGSGYQAAILAGLAAQVHSIERHPKLAQAARQVLHALQIDNVSVHTGDGSLGLPELAPFDGILVTAAAPHAPQPLLRQLKEGGRLVIPVGDRLGQNLELWTRQEGRFESESIAPVAFVPLIGVEGWGE